MGLKGNQKWCATSFGRSIAVTAGAGSGKTFTLKSRIVNAFNKELVGRDDLVVDDINQVLAITFTEKAALELKSRIKVALREAGRADQAVLVDGAWISTIHGMCSRILKENSLALGIDPAFELASDDRRLDFLNTAIEETFASQEMKSVVDELLKEYRHNTLVTMATALIEAAAKSPAELDSIEFLRLGGAEEKLAVLEKLAYAQTDGHSRPTAELIDYVNKLFVGKDVPKDAYLQHPWGIEGSKVGHQRDYPTLNARLAYGAKHVDKLMAFVRFAYKRFGEYKHDHGVLDNNDLLIRAAQALKDPSIQALYKDKFKLVVIDEFQDTDQMQLDIICNFTGEHNERLCVVGDPQQSIYRFRGADLSVCSGHLASLAHYPNEPQELYLRPMGDNFRSAQEVLSFVDDVFSDRVVAQTRYPAPNYFQHLAYARDESRVTAPFSTAEGARVQVIEVEHLHNRQKLARTFLAESVADRFLELNRAGRSYGDMVILLGAMTHADEYAQALAKRSIPCAITGGSVLSKRADAKVMVSLAHVLANPRDSQALVGLLESELFGFEPADFMALDAGVPVMSSYDEGESAIRDSARGSIGDAFAELVMLTQSVEPHDRLTRAAFVMRKAYSAMQTTAISRVMTQVLVDCGWISRMQAQDHVIKSIDDDTQAVSVGGRARVADALKVIRMVQALEDEGYRGASEISKRLAIRLYLVKEAPGVLSANNDEFVRIMTIHASKGLEFPVVAVGELGPRSGGGSQTGRLKIETTWGVSYAVLDLERSLVDGTTIAQDSITSQGEKIAAALARDELGMTSDDVVTDEVFNKMLKLSQENDSYAYVYQAIKEHALEQDEEELERLNYVAFTRATEALIVLMTCELGTTAIDAALKGLNLPSGAQEALGNRIHVCLLGVDAAPKGRIPALIHARRDQLVAHGVDYQRIYNACFERWVAQAYKDESLECAREASRRATHGEVLDFDYAKDIQEEAPQTEQTEASQTEQAEPPQTEQAGFLIPQKITSHHAVNLPFSRVRSRGMVSASALHTETSIEPQRLESLTDDFDDEPSATATERGSAFHALAECAARNWHTGEQLREPVGKIHALAKTYKLSHVQTQELEAELLAWLKSPHARAAAAHNVLIPEAPFTLAIPRDDDSSNRIKEKSPLVLSGFIDLLAYDEFGKGCAYVVDYKTGRYLSTDEARRAAYQTQAECYAYALLAQGFSSVELHFVFVDQLDSDGMPMVCSFPKEGEQAYSYDQLQRELLKASSLL